MQLSLYVMTVTFSLNIDHNRLVLCMPVCHFIGLQSHDCPITGTVFEYNFL